MSDSEIDPGHTLTVHFDDGDREYVTFKCHRTGAARKCAVIDCPVDHEDVNHECVEKHGARALDKCWAEDWWEAIGREAANTEALRPVSFPVHVYFDDGVVLENVEAPDEQQ